MPVLTKQGKMLLKRQGWDGRSIYQVLNDSDSRIQGNKPYMPIRTEEGTLGKNLSTWARSKRIVMLDKEKCETGESIDTSSWWLVDSNEFSFPDGIKSIWYRIDDNTRPTISLLLDKDGKELEETLLECDLFKPRDKTEKKAVEEKIKTLKEGNIVEYKGTQFNRNMKEAFKNSKETQARGDGQVYSL